MAVDMKDALQGIRAVVEYQSVAGLKDSGYCSNIPGRKKDMAGNIEIFRLQIAERSNMPDRNDQHMLRRRRRNIPESHDMFVAVALRSRNLSTDNATEKTFGIMKNRVHE